MLPEVYSQGSCGGGRRLTAKLFAGLTILVVVFAFVSAGRPQVIDLYFHGTYIVLFFSHLLRFIALVSAGFAFTYFVAARWSAHPLNRSLGIAHFAFMALACFLILLTLRQVGVYVPKGAMEGDQAPLLWPFVALNFGALSFLAGCATFGVNQPWLDSHQGSSTRPSQMMNHVQSALSEDRSAVMMAGRNLK